MTKKILLIILVLLLIVISIFSYNFYKNVKQPINSNSIVAVPQNAALIFQGKNFKEIIRKLNFSTIIWEKLVSNTTSANSFNQQLNYINSFLNDAIINQITLNQTVLISIHQVGNVDFDAIYYCSTSKGVDTETLINRLKAITKLTPETRVYDDVTIYNFNTHNNQKLAFIYYKGIIAFSFSSILIEDVIRQLNTETSLLDDTNFSTVLQTAGEADFGNIFINIAQLNKISNSFLNNAIKPFMKDAELFSNWMALDASIRSNAVMLNGFNLAQDSSTLFLSIFKDQKPQDQELINILPKNTAFIYYQGLSDMKLFFKKKHDLLKQRNQALVYETLIDNYTTNNQIDIVEEWLSFLGNEMAAVITEPVNDLDYTNNEFLVFNISNVDNAKKILQNIGLKINDEDYPIVTFNEFQLSKIDFKDFFTTFFGKPFFNLNQPYYTIIDDYLIFGSTENSLKDFINEYISKRTFENDVNFSGFKEFLSSTSTIFIYNNIARSVKLYPNFLSEDYLKIVEDKTELLRKFEAVSLQISSQKNNLYYSNFYLKYNPVYKQDTRSVWETELEAEIIGKPEVVINHTNNTKEIFVQDKNNKVYLISNTGKILWSKQVSGQIMGKIHQVDALKNNKLQLLFNTSEKIYLLDRNGHDVGKFPVQLKSPATNGITPLDYEKNRNYRLMIGCQNNMVYNFDIEGNLVQGWEYQAENSSADKEIYHFVISNKDYIAIPLQNGFIKVIERSGKDRLRLKNKLPKSNFVHLNLSSDLSKVFFSTLDSTGNIVKLFFNDKIESSTISDIPSNAYFENFDVTNDNTKDYIFAYNKTIRVTDVEKKEILKTDIKDEITSSPLFFKMPNQSIKIGLVTLNNIYLINSQGSIENNFPLTGSTPFTITNLSNDDHLNLIVGDKKLVYMYNLE